MDFEQARVYVLMLPAILLILAMGAILVGNAIDTWQEYTLIYLGLAWVMVFSSLIVLQFGEEYVMNYYGKDRIEVYEDGSYITVVVPKEDEGIVTSLDYTVNELEDKYNTGYTGERYMDKDEVVEIKLDTETNYKIVE